MEKLLTVIAAIVVVLVIIIGVVTHQSGKAPLSEPPAPPAAGPQHQPDWCPGVEVIAAPGSWESAANDDPINPHANPKSFMLSITKPLQEQFPEGVEVWTLPYTAQFRNVNALGEKSYDGSRQEGTDKVNQRLASLHKDCPATEFVLTGFSQGAVLLGDIASNIGLGHGAVPAEKIRGVALVADGRRTAESGQVVGNPVAGVGAEVALQPLNAAVQLIIPGATMRGPRQGGFGTLNDRTFQICAPDDHICDAPVNALNGVERAQQLINANGVHAMYATNPNVIPGTTANQWVVGWAADLIRSR